MVFKVGIGQPKLTGASLKRLTAIIGFKDTQMDMSTCWLCLMWRSTSSEVSFTKGAGAFCPANGNQLSKTSCTDNISMTKQQNFLLTLQNELELIGPGNFLSTRRLQCRHQRIGDSRIIHGDGIRF